MTLLLLFSAGLLVLVLVPGVGVGANGADAVAGLGQLSIQPSELAKLALILFVADLLARRADRIHDRRLTLWPVMVVFGGCRRAVMLQPNLGTTLILAVIVLVMLFVAGVAGRPLAVRWGSSAAGAAGRGGGSSPTASVASSPSETRGPTRPTPATRPSRPGRPGRRRPGTGLGQGRAKYGFLPYAHTDFIFAIIGEELGLLGALAVVALFVGSACWACGLALQAPDRFGMLVAAGVTTWILVQAFLNIGAVVGVLPITGVPLPFVSYGGSSLLVTMAAVGLLLNVARQAR